MWTTFKVFIEFVTILFPFHVLAFGRQACGFLVPRPGIEPAPPALGSKVLTTGPPGMSPIILNLTQLRIANFWDFPGDPNQKKKQE